LTKKLEDYIKIYQSLDEDFCEKIRKELELANWKKHTFYNVTNKNNISMSGSKELDISYEEIHSKKELMQKIWEVIYKYIAEDFATNYFGSWEGFSSVRFNRYKEGQLMAIHCDHIHSLFEGERRGIPILSIVGSLNNDYEGGEFLMFDEEKEYKIKAGEIMIFPSVFLYPHRVSPVKKGVRDTFVSWVW
jgi:predicted 2-oxoglutarate/Fe(II)-dependent dioxygenase YbiX